MFDEVKEWLGRAEERKVFLGEIGRRLSPEHAARITRLLELLDWLLSVLEKKRLSIRKLLELCFGSKTESARNVCGKAPKTKQRQKRKGHGRNGHLIYTGARRVKVPNPVHKDGETCPGCGKGRLRPMKKPAVAVSVTAQPPVGAVVHEMEQLRCDTCDKVFTAPTPPEAGVEKYDASVGVMVGLLRYGSGMPFHRLERLQKSLGVPLPASIQWEQVLRILQSLEPIHKQAVKQAAQSLVVHSDDTKARVTALFKEIRSQEKPKRTGIFTTGIVGKVDGHTVCLFYTGRKHAGENLAELLEQRDENLSAPLHMCDGLSRNEPKGHETVECQCNVHGRRNFVELEKDHPEESRKVVESYSEVYRVEAEVRKRGLNDEERLRVHQEQSGPVMEELRRWFAELMDGKKVEPNSNLGGAIRYMQNRWTELTQFLRVPGAPIDNNEVERELKTSILHRKNSLFYMTERGAHAGDVFMSIIETCRRNGANPFDYLMAVVRNESRMEADPGAWMPWNYLKTEAGLNTQGVR